MESVNERPRNPAPDAPARAESRTRRAAIMVFAALLVLAAALRLVGLGSSPPGLFRDEAEKGYTALELWQTGRHGEFRDDGYARTRFLPAFVEVGGVETSAIYQYLSAPIVGVFGLSVTTTRLVAALAGIALVIVLVWLGALMMPHDQRPIAWAWMGVAAAGFVAVDGTHVLFSRWAQQGITLPVWTCAGVALALATPRLAERHRRAASIGAGLLLALAVYAYDPARVVVPLIVLGVLWELRGRLGNWRAVARVALPGAIVFLAFAVPVVVFGLTQGGARFARLSVFAQHGIGGGLVVAAGNWLAHFDPRFLFVHGDTNARHGLALSGMMGWGAILFFLAGIVSLFRVRGGRRLLVVWLLAAPVAASLTTEGIPHALRSILMIPVLALIAARGACWMATGAPRLAAIAVVTAWIATAMLTTTAVFRILPRDGAPWQYGVLESLAVMERTNPGGSNVLSAEVPYAWYYVLFFEQPHAADWHESPESALRTQILPPGAPLPPGALVARPPQGLFGRAEGLDVPALGGDPASPPAMRVRQGW